MDIFKQIADIFERAGKQYEIPTNNTNKTNNK